MAAVIPAPQPRHTASPVGGEPAQPIARRHTLMTNVRQEPATPPQQRPQPLATESAINATTPATPQTVTTPLALPAKPAHQFPHRQEFVKPTLSAPPVQNFTKAKLPAKLQTPATPVRKMPPARNAG